MGRSSCSDFHDGLGHNLAGISSGHRALYKKMALVADAIGNHLPHSYLFATSSWYIQPDHDSSLPSVFKSENCS